MANSQQLTEYFASFGFKINTASVTAVKKQIASIKTDIEKKLTFKIKLELRNPKTIQREVNKALSGVSIKLNKFSVNGAALRREIREQANKGVGVRIDNFSVNGAALRSAVQAAYDRGVTLNINPRVNPLPRTRGANNESTADRLLRSNRLARYGNAPEVLNRFGFGLGGAAAGLSVMGVNTISEDLQTSRIALETITKGRGDQTYEWLKNQGNEFGFNYRDQLPLLSSYLGASMNKQGYEKSLESYTDISQYGLTHGADKESSKRAMNSINQMWSKGQIMAEELKGQLSEAKGFSGAREIFAAAYQESIGGKLTGQKSERALIDAMKAGKVMSADVLPIVSRMMGEQAAGGIEAYKQTTGYNRGRFENAATNAVEIFGKGGFDKGMASMFAFLTKEINASSEAIKNFGNFFMHASRHVQNLIGTFTGLYTILHDINPTLTNLLLTLAPIYRIFGKWGVIISGLLLVFDDLKVYFEGGTSVIGAFIDELNQLFGMDAKPFVAMLGGIALAITAAFSPITAAIFAMSGLIAIYKALKARREADANIVERPRIGAELPNAEDITQWHHKATAQNAEAAKGTGFWNEFTANGAHRGSVFGAWTGWMPLKATMNGALLTNPALREKLFKAQSGGLLTQEQVSNLQYAVGSGYYTQEQASSAIDRYVSERNLDPLGRKIEDQLKGVNLTLNIAGTLTDTSIPINLGDFQAAGAHFTNSDHVPVR